MTTSEKSLTAERLRGIMDYDPEIGVFTRKVRTANCVRVGDVAGSFTSKGYIRIKIDGRLYFAHRLAWLYVHGEWPVDQVDHINGIKNDNRIVNLREGNNAENQHNQRKPQANNKTGLLGVAPSYGKFVAQITVDRKYRHLGTFPTPEEAHAAYLAAKRQLHSHNTL